VALRTKAAARASLTCAGCQARAEEVAFLRERLARLEETLVAGSPQGPALRDQERPGPKVEPDTFIGPEGQAMVLLDGKPVPWTEWKRGQDALDAALAGKAVEIPATDNGGGR
jgi:hypothetical protein